MTLAQDWRFHLGDVQDADQASFDDSDWEAVTLPHTWNAQDGQDGPSTPYYRGIGWYRTRFRPPDSLGDRTVYLQFEGASMIADVFVNGQAAGHHAGAFATFRFDVTSLLAAGDNLIAVKVDNSAGLNHDGSIDVASPTSKVAPLHADFTFFGGLYRPVRVLATPQLAINPRDYGSAGVYLDQEEVNAEHAQIGVRVGVDNRNADERTATLRATLLDDSGAELMNTEGVLRTPAMAQAAARLELAIDSPHLWQGVDDPYLYSVRVDLVEDGSVIDSSTQPLGVRSFAVDPDAGFALNGRQFDLHGVSRHQDKQDHGWAISDADIDDDFTMLAELSPTALRLAHYQHATHTYEVADRMGLIVWAEVPLIDRINDDPAFTDNVTQQLLELIRQNYNHPSIAFWSVGNEVLLDRGPDPDALVAHLTDLVTQEDRSRIVGYAANAGDISRAVNWHGAAHGFNQYLGWYHGTTDQVGDWLDMLHTQHPGAPVGLTEYGAGASVAQHTADPAAQDRPRSHTRGPHPEEYQTYFHEQWWKAVSARPFLWAKFVWNGFDFASDARSEGDQPGRNDKGLVTYDRHTKKDAFYFYKANWSNDPFVYITSRRYLNLANDTTTVKVYSNLPSVELLINDTSIGSVTASDHVFLFTNVPFISGDNRVRASAEAEASIVTDEVTWTKD